MQSSINFKNRNLRNSNRSSAGNNAAAPDLARFTFAAFQGFGSTNGNSSAKVSFSNPRFGSPNKTAPTSPNIKAFLG